VLSPRCCAAASAWLRSRGPPLPRSCNARDAAAPRLDDSGSICVGSSSAATSRFVFSWAVQEGQSDSGGEAQLPGLRTGEAFGHLTASLIPWTSAWLYACPRSSVPLDLSVIPRSLAS
jgi:hypothetical protein